MDDLERVTLTRRIPVRELRSKGWRTRVVTVPQDRAQHETLDALVEVVLHFFDHACYVRRWKRDVSQAFRRVPVAPEHLQFIWGVWADQGTLWVAQHKGTPFGTIAAVYSWHRVGHLLKLLVLMLFLAPVCRYVDDFFGASKVGVKLTGGVILSVLASLLGYPCARPCDESKSADLAVAMTVLGSLCAVSFSECVLYTKVDPEKAQKYRAQLASLLSSQTLSAGEASKLAGRLSFAVTVSGNHVGRAFIKPCYAQARSPLPHDMVSPRLHQAAEWFDAYLQVCPAAARRCKATERTQCVTWSDAAGATRWVAAVLEAGGQYFWTRMQTPDFVWGQLLDRGDSQIGFQEMLGLLLVWETFQSWLAGALWVSFVDNDGVLHAVMKGGGGGPERNNVVGRLWLKLAAASVDLHVARVESGANPADGPTRDFFEVLQRVKAKWVEPQLPSWLQHLWCVPEV